MSEKRHIAFVARALTRGGVTRFIENILEIWNSHLPNYVSVTLFTDEPKFAKRYKNLKVILIPPSNILFWDNFLLLQALLKSKPNIVFYTKNVIPLTHLLQAWNKNVIVHDLAFFYPKLRAYKFLDTLYMKCMTRVTLPFAHTVIAISKFTASELKKFLNIPEKKLLVIHHGVGKEFKKNTNQKILKKIQKKYSLRLPFIFYSGSLSPRKNIMRLLKAFHGLNKTIPHTLYIASGKKWNTSEVFQYVKVNRLEKRIIFLPFLQEKELISFYSMAEAFLYPSLYEGFGLPIIEAQACGLPVLTSNTTSCKEIAGMGYSTVNPENIKEIQTGIQNILTKKEYTKKLIQLGYKNSQRYSWEKSAKKLLSL